VIGRKDMLVDLKVKVLAYKGDILIWTIDETADRNYLPMGGNRIGCLVTDTGTRLGISREALELLRGLKRVGDDLGEVDAWIAGGKKHCFGWLGPPIRLVPADAVTSGIEDIDFVEIANEVDEEKLLLALK